MTIYCQLLERDIDSKRCESEYSSMFCKKCSYFKDSKKVSLDKYRRKPYTPLFSSPCGDEKSISILSHIIKLEKVNPNNKFLKLMRELGDKGANLDIINDALDLPPKLWEKKTQSPNLKRDFENKSDYFNREKVIKNAAKVICELKPVFQGLNRGDSINKKVLSAQLTLEKEIQRYLDFLIIEECYDLLCEELGSTDGLRKQDPDALLNLVIKSFPPQRVRSWLKKKSVPATQSAKIWNESIVQLVDELIHIGYSNKSAYTKVAEILHESYQETFPEMKPDHIRQRYAYHKKKMK